MSRPGIVALTAGAFLAATAPAAAVPSNNVGVDTTIVSRSLSGGLPNGPSIHPVISLDARFATLLPFQSTATDLVAQPTGGGSNVFFVKRAQPFDDTGSPWSPGPIQLASRGRHGKPANGPSTLPAVGGDNKHSPACIAFISAASNLVAGDTNGKPDAFAFFRLRGRAKARPAAPALRDPGRWRLGSAGPLAEREGIRVPHPRAEPRLPRTGSGRLLADRSAAPPRRPARDARPRRPDAR